MYRLQLEIQIWFAENLFVVLFFIYMWFLIVFSLLFFLLMDMSQLHILWWHHLPGHLQISDQYHSCRFEFEFESADILIKEMQLIEHIDSHGQNILYLKNLNCVLRLNLSTFRSVPVDSIDLTLNVRGPSYLDLTRSISWLLMPWLLTSPGYQQPWYWLCRICRSWSYLRKDFKYMCHINVE